MFPRAPFIVPAYRRFMSVHALNTEPVTARKKVTIQTLHALRKAKTPITMVTAYDYPSARTISSNPDIDITLVGDSLAQVCLGYSSTTQLTLQQMIHHAAAVARGTTHPFLVADMTFGSYHTTPAEATANAVELIRSGSMDAVKIEGGVEVEETVRKLTSVGIPVMAHVGLLPQRHTAFSGFRVQGRDADGALKVYHDALRLQQAGAFSIVLEAVPSELAQYITERLSIPTIGIGAGPGTNGQVLVWDDIMTTTQSPHKPKFVRRFADAQSVREAGLKGYAEAVRARTFPDPATEGYPMASDQWARFLEKAENKTEGS